jgi:hypothetical protein
MTTRTIQSPDDDGGSSVGESALEKARGSYKCGRVREPILVGVSLSIPLDHSSSFCVCFCVQCGVPKKGHVCPYQPKVKRRPDEPPPEMRNAAVQVERDEFMTLRRLNIRIQGFPESYVTEPYRGESMVVGEVNPISVQMEQEQNPMEGPAAEVEQA